MSLIILYPPAPCSPLCHLPLALLPVPLFALLPRLLRPLLVRRLSLLLRYAASAAFTESGPFILSHSVSLFGRFEFGILAPRFSAPPFLNGIRTPSWRSWPAPPRVRGRRVEGPAAPPPRPITPDHPHHPLRHHRLRLPHQHRHPHPRRPVRATHPQLHHFRTIVNSTCNGKESSTYGDSPLYIDTCSIL